MANRADQHETGTLQARTVYTAQEYEICQRRGHESSGWQAMSNPPQEICKWCGVHFRVEPARTVEVGSRLSP